MACEIYTSPILPKEEKILIQNIVGTLLYYSREVYPTILVSLGSVSINWYKSNETTTQVIKQMLYYCANRQYAAIHYKESDMVIRVHSYRSYLSESQARSRAGEGLFLNTLTKVTTMVLSSPFCKLLKISWHHLPRRSVYFFYKCQLFLRIMNHLRGNGTYTTGHTYASVQFNLWWYHEQKNATKTLQGNVYAVLLGER